jgi:adenylate cyclase
MVQETFKRKLTAVLSADAEGYSRLMGDDDVATVRTITEYRKTMASLIKQYDGRVVDSPGDNLLAEFISVVNAARCAVDIQRNLSGKNSRLPENRRMLFRIGINLGDVIDEGDRIYGDGVNIASRVEALAERGGISVTGNVYDVIRDKLPLKYEYQGEHSVKNIKDPVRVYRVMMAADTAPAVENTETPISPKPTIAVLPLVNMSDDPKQGFLCDGITEEIITGLSQVPQLSVAARNATFIYKNKPVDPRQLGRQLGVQYLLEGSVQKAGDRVRISAQLIDTKTGHHLWAERYDRHLKDIFALQDDITLKIMAALQVKLTNGEQAKTYVRGTQNLNAYKKILKGFEYYFRFNKDGTTMARRIAKEVIELDPEYPKGHVLMAFTLLRDVMFGWSGSPEQAIAKAKELAEKALGMDDTSATTHALRSNVYLVEGLYDQAVAELEKALTLNPYRADNIGLLGIVLNYAGETKKAISMFKKAMTLNPIPPDWYYHQLAASYAATGQFEKAVSNYKKSLQRNPDNIPAHAGLAAIYGATTKEGNGRREAAEVLRLDPRFSCECWKKTLPGGSAKTIRQLVAGIRKSGLK